jgi:hypothetical protein
MVASSHNPGLGLGFASRADLDFQHTYESMADGMMPLQSDDVPWLRMPGIYSDPGGYVSSAAEVLRLSMGGEPVPSAGGVGGAGTASAFLLSKNTVWMLAAAAVAVIVLSRRGR